jgi:diguanylate cyclase (GGDEF)-like protein
LGIGPLILSYVAGRIPGLVRQSQVEPKTGLFNSVHFGRELARALDAAGRQGVPVSVVMLDLDHLRALNNRVGHLAGDRAIAAVASLISEASLPDGLAARFGGEEFCLLLPGSTAAEARRRAEAIRSQLDKAAHVWGERREPLRITISAGVASFPEHAETAEGLLEAADVAMYDAKAAGRNRVRVAVSAHARAALVLDALPAVAPSPLRSDAEQVLLSAAPAQPQVTPLPDRDEARPVEPVHEQIEPDAAEDSPAGRRFVPWFVALLVAGTTAVALTASPGAVAAHTWLFLLLVVAVVALDEVSVDLFHSGNVSPGSVPTLALAFLFGPLGPVASEIAVALKRCLRREPPVRWLFDLGALGLAGAGAAAVFELASDGGPMGTLAGAALGGLAYYAVNIALLATVMALNEGRRLIETWRERLAWLAPHYVAFGLLAGGTVMTQQALGLFALPVFGVPVIMLLVAERQYIRRSRSSVEELRRRHEELEQANHKLRALLESNQRLLRGMHHSYLSTITSLARTIEAKDPYTGGHTERVARVACLLAVELGLSEREIEAVQVGGIIHDIGKVGVPDAVLLKPGRLTEAEFDEMRRHPEVSSYILSDLELPAIVKQMARSHHERYDGNGYPDRLAGEEIPLAARILTVADALDAMTSDRPYRSALPLDVAVAEIDAQAGRQFCPRVVAALHACLKRDATLGGEYRSASRLVDVDPFAADRAAVHHRSVQA